MKVTHQARIDESRRAILERCAAAARGWPEGEPLSEEPRPDLTPSVLWSAAMICLGVIGTLLAQWVLP